MKPHRPYARHYARTSRKTMQPTDAMSARILWHIVKKKLLRTLTYGSVTCLLLILTWGVFESLKNLHTDGKGFNLTDLTISPLPHSESFLTYDTLPLMAELKYGENIFTIDLGQVEKRLTALPEILSVTLTRKLPGTIQAQIEERLPVARCVMNNKTYLVDSDGYCFTSPLAVSSLIKRLPLLHHSEQNSPEKLLFDIGFRCYIKFKSDYIASLVKYLFI